MHAPETRQVAGQNSVVACAMMAGGRIERPSKEERRKKGERKAWGAHDSGVSVRMLEDEETFFNGSLLTSGCKTKDEG